MTAEDRGDEVAERSGAAATAGGGSRRGGDEGATKQVGVNLLWLVPGVVGGSEEYTTRLLRALAEQAPPDLHLTLFALASFADAHPDLVASYPTVTAHLDGRNKAERVAAEATWLAREAGRRRIEVLHHAVNRSATNLTFALYRDFPDAERARGGERF